MRLTSPITYESLSEWLRNFSTFNDAGDYDFNGAIGLLLSIVDNLARHHLPVDIENLEESDFAFTPAQKGFLTRLLEVAH